MPSTGESLDSLVKQVLAATSVIEVAIKRMAAGHDDKLTNLTVAVGKLTDLATLYAPPPELTPATRQRRALSARAATSQALTDAIVALNSFDALAIEVDLLEATGSVGNVTVTA